MKEQITNRNNLQIIPFLLLICEAEEKYVSRFRVIAEVILVAVSNVFYYFLDSFLREVFEHDFIFKLGINELT